jgi:hypothetical protein
MSVSVSFHIKQSSKIEVQGYATSNQYSGIYPVLKIASRQMDGVLENDVTIFANVEQLEEIGRELNKAISAYHNLKLKEAKSEE